ncbi:hypothetical protein SAMD00019534_036010 [Acytostelium subglobosum LB1]|uniref:hypothetical protein n=1 Tax=Acytostelium subglobosum LB1 TaxID=1410327 RepID=UPI00064513A1|nr:hypothetical protein SAMD00019534_036010 [Acytostelium subglobosum LB1]GAM20426.1 hypothetical protein SAMD00019534_036010 [Acytostelium subglobosum LB1]|eukprot:XP_012759947.1 hypothetical protein SAMD00019534_036010 [Acytostelium subglobosum LB1]
MVIFCAIALGGLTAPYFIYMVEAYNVKAWLAFGLYIASAFILLVLAVIGLISAIKKNRGLLLYFAMTNMVMLIFGVAQIIVTSLTLTNCDDENNNFNFLCSKNTAGYFAPVAVLLFINLIATVFSLVLRWKLVNDTKGDYY